jgi:hypothetical protein
MIHLDATWRPVFLAEGTMNAMHRSPYSNVLMLTMVIKMAVMIN